MNQVWAKEPERYALVRIWDDRSRWYRRRISPTVIATNTNRAVLTELAVSIANRSVHYKNMSWSSWLKTMWDSRGAMEVWTRYAIVNLSELFKNTGTTY